jgi:glycerophosphoryl diester phosphodiesterase
MHRGLSSRYFENTVDSFTAAGKTKSTWGIETDIYLTANDTDNNHPLVCTHDVNPFRYGNALTRDAGYYNGDGEYQQGVCNPTPTAYDPLWDVTTGETKITNLTLSQIQSKTLWTGYCGTNQDPAKGNVGDQIVLNNVFNKYGIGGDYHVPTFKEYLNICKQYNKEAVIEIKDENAFWNNGQDYANALILEMINEINEVNYASHCTIIAFDGSVYDDSKPDQPFWHALESAISNPTKNIANTASQLFPKFQKLCWADYGHQDPFAEAYLALNNEQNIDVDYNILLGKGGQDLVKLAHEKNLKVNCWTINDQQDCNTLKKLGVDQITGNVVF